MKVKNQVITSVTLPELANRLKAVRGSGAHTQAQVSQAAGKNTATYTYWEAGSTEPGALALTRACLFMGVTPNDILLPDATLGAILERVPKKEAARVVSIISKASQIIESGKGGDALELVESLLTMYIQAATTKKS